jgi:hypothetical protein
MRRRLLVVGYWLYDVQKDSRPAQSHGFKPMAL